MTSGKAWKPYIVMERKLLSSKAYLWLTGCAPQVYGLFRLRCQPERTGREGRKEWVIANNGRLVFTYQEAKEKWGFKSGRFRDAVDELIEHGLLDIAEPGDTVGARRRPTLYAISNRWERYGQADFEEKPRGRRRTHHHTTFQERKDPNPEDRDPGRGSLDLGKPGEGKARK